LDVLSIDEVVSGADRVNAANIDARQSTKIDDNDPRTPRRLTQHLRELRRGRKIQLAGDARQRRAATTTVKRATQRQLTAVWRTGRIRNDWRAVHTTSEG